jgi:hypothetical protein
MMPTNVPPGLSNVVSVAAGPMYALALRSDGSIVAWGIASSTPPVSLTNVVAIAGGVQNQPYALCSDGTVASWDNHGALLPVAGLSNSVAIASGLGHGIALCNDGTVFGWGGNPYGETGFISSLSNVVSVAAGWDGSLVKFGSGAPNITLHPFSRIVRGGQPFTLTSLAVGQPSLHYQWQRNGNDLLAATNTSFPISSASLADAGDYRCIFTNVLGAATSVVATITIVFDPPRFDTQSLPPQLGAGGFQMRVNDLSGLGPLVIYASSNLVDWVPIFTNPATTDAVIFIDPAATNLPLRFYRADEDR